MSLSAARGSTIGVSRRKAPTFTARGGFSVRRDRTACARRMPERLRSCRATGDMQFDTADLSAMEADGTLNDVIMHEMGHVIGIGTILDEQEIAEG